MFIIKNYLNFKIWFFSLVIISTFMDGAGYGKSGVPSTAPLQINNNVMKALGIKIGDGRLAPREGSGRLPPREGGGTLPHRDSGGAIPPRNGGEDRLPPPVSGGGGLPPPVSGGGGGLPPPPGKGGGGGLPPGSGSAPRKRNKEIKPEVAQYSYGKAPGIEEYTKLGYCTGETTVGFLQSPKSDKILREYHLVVTSVQNTFVYSEREHRKGYFMKIAMADQNGNELPNCGNLSHVEPGTSLQNKGRAINAPPLFFNEGEKAKIVVHNKSDSPMTIHWHGIFLATQMDGIPGFQAPIGINKTFKYEFELTQNGTYWYHPHDLNEQDTRGAMIIFAAPKGQIVKNPDGSTQMSAGEWITYPSTNPQKNTSYNHDRMIMMSDYMDRVPRKLLNLLQNDQDSYMFDSGYSRGFYEQPQCRAEYLENFKSMKMFWMDPADVWYDLFFLNDETCLNCGPWSHHLSPVRSEVAGQTFHKLNEFSQFTKNDRIRLRLINSSASSYFHVHYGNTQAIKNPKEKLDMLIVAKDGQAVEPEYVDALYMGMGETYDVIIDIPDDKTLYELKIKSIDDYDPKVVNGKIERETRRMARVLIGDGRGSAEETKLVPAYEQSITLCGPRKSQEDPIKSTSYSELKRRTPPSLHPGQAPVTDALRLPYYKKGDHVFQRLKLSGNMNQYYWEIKPDDKKTKFKYFDMAGDLTPYIEIAHDRYNFIQITNTMMDGMMNHPWHLHGLYFKLLDPEELKLSEAEINQLLQDRPLLHTATIKPKEVKVIAFYAANEYRGAWMFHCHNLYHMASDMMMFVKYDNFDFSELPTHSFHQGHSKSKDGQGQGHSPDHGHSQDDRTSHSQILNIQEYLLDSLGIQDGFVTAGMSAAGGINPRDGTPVTHVDANLKTRMNCRGGRCFAEIITGVSNQNFSGKEMSFNGSGRICSGTKCATLSYSYATEYSGVKSHTALAGMQYRVYNSDIFVLNGAVGSVCKSNPNDPYNKSDNRCRPAGDVNAALQITNGKIGAFNQLIPQSQAVYRGQLAVGCDGELCSNLYGKVGGEALINRNLKLIAFCKVGTDKNESLCMAGLSIMLDPFYNFGRSH